MDPISIEKIRAMSKCSNCKRQQQKQQMILPTLAISMVATSVLFLLVTSPVWVPRLCSVMAFFLTTLPDLAMAFLLSRKCLFVIGNLIVAFLIGESRLAPRAKPASLVNEIHEEHVKRNPTTSTKVMTAAVAIDHNALVGELGQGVQEEEEDEEGEEEELHQRVEDFIARVKKQRRLEDKSIFDTDR